MAKVKGNEKEDSSKVGEAIEPQSEGTGGQHGIRGQGAESSTAESETGSKEEKSVDRVLFTKKISLKDLPTHNSEIILDDRYAEEALAYGKEEIRARGGTSRGTKTFQESTEFHLHKGADIFYRLRDEVLPAKVTSHQGSKVNLVYFMDDGSGRTGGAKAVTQGFTAGQWHYSEYAFKVYMSVELKGV